MTTAARPRSRRTILLVVLGLVLAVAAAALALGGRDDSGIGVSSAQSEPEQLPGLAEPADAEAAAGSGPDLAFSVTEEALSSEDLVVTASQEVVVADAAAAARQLTAGVAAAGGQVTSEYTSTVGTCPEPMLDGAMLRDCGAAPGSTITYRAPLDAVDSLMALAAGLGKESWRTRSATDVGAQIADVDARVTSARASLDRLNALMARAETLTDVIALESQISTRQAELESLLAQQAALADRTAMATVTATLVSGAAPADEPAGFSGGLQSGMQALGSAAVALVTVLGWALPFLVLGSVVLLPLLAWRRRRNPRPAAPQQAQDEQVGAG